MKAQQRGFLVAELLIGVAVLGLFATTMLMALQWHYQFVLQRPLAKGSASAVEIAWQQRLQRQLRTMSIGQGERGEN